ncbi:hypothetical protein E4U51_005276 [Claviceps purpurea]|nr:hypothetical protein E4U51_005276 [Claviceps purpurea]
MEPVTGFPTTIHVPRNRFSSRNSSAQYWGGAELPASRLSPTIKVASARDKSDNNIITPSVLNVLTLAVNADQEAQTVNGKPNLSNSCGSSFLQGSFRHETHAVVADPSADTNTEFGREPLGGSEVGEPLPAVYQLLQFVSNCMPVACERGDCGWFLFAVSKPASRLRRDSTNHPSGEPPRLNDWVAQKVDALHHRRG